MLRADGQAVISFNGEIYNYQALRRELLASDQPLLTQGDTEVLLAGHQRWGTAGLLARLRGMFAFALWDMSTERHCCWPAITSASSRSTTRCSPTARCCSRPSPRRCCAARRSTAAST
jgi:hypothetical protein